MGAKDMACAVGTGLSSAMEPASSLHPSGFDPSRGADRQLIYEALRFYFWAAGQGICPNDDQDCLEPEEGFWQYSLRTGDECWETVADRFRDSDGNPEGGDGTAPSRSDDSAGPQGIAQGEAA